MVEKASHSLFAWRKVVNFDIIIIIILHYFCLFAESNSIPFLTNVLSHSNYPIYSKKLLTILVFSVSLYVFKIYAARIG